MADTGKRARNRARIEAQIIGLGRRQLGEVGAAALSLREIARGLGMASSAVYRYVSSRDALLTLLIVTVYDELGDVVDTALEAAGDDPGARWRAVWASMRGWALEHPYDWALVYGSPVPDYHAPAEQTTESGTRVTDQALRIVVEAHAAGRTTTAATADPGAVEAAAAMLGRMPEEVRLPPEVFLAACSAWVALVGAINAEVFAYLGDDVPRPEAFYGGLVDSAGAMVLAPPL